MDPHPFSLPISLSVSIFPMFLSFYRSPRMRWYMDGTYGIGPEDEYWFRSSSLKRHPQKERQVRAFVIAARRSSASVLRRPRLPSRLLDRKDVHEFV